MIHKSVDVKSLILAKYEECRMIAIEHGYDLKPIPVYFNKTGCVAGTYQHSMIGGGFFNVNLDIAKANLEEYLRQTVPHEFCHYIVFMEFYKNMYRYNQKPKSHGREWQSMMINVFGLDPHRCHNYDVTEIQKKKFGRLYVYKCKCMEHQVTPIRHRRMLEQPNRYACRKCNATLAYVGNK
jgi:SprT protein